MDNPHHSNQDMRSNKKIRQENDVVYHNEGNNNDLLTLSLSFPAQIPPPSPPPPPPPPSSSDQTASYHPNIPSLLNVSHTMYQLPTLPPPPPSPPPSMAPSSSVARPRRNPTQTPKRKGKSNTVPAPYPWATTRRATIHTLDYILVSERIETITGEVQCKRCEKQFQIGFNLREKFLEVGSFVAKNKGSMHDRAPSVWMNPVLPPCCFCEQENSAKPVLEGVKKRDINWLFLLLGQMLGCCTLKQLKYFCKHTKNHRTGAKDRVLYLAYLELCKQLDPNGPFDR